MSELKLDIEKYFMVPHFKVIGTYPGTKQKVGDIIYPSTHENAQAYIDHPAIFKQLEWWENRSFEKLMEIEFVEVKTKGYYVPGDKLKVNHFLFAGLDTRHPRIVGFAASIDHRGNHNYKFTECIPATEAKLLEP